MALGRAHYLRERSADGSVNKTILKPLLAVAVRHQWDFPDVKLRVAALRPIRYRRKQSGYDLRTIIRIVLKSQSVCPRRDIYRHATFIQIYARVFSNHSNRQTDRQTNKHGQKHVPPPLLEVNKADK